MSIMDELGNRIREFGQRRKDNPIAGPASAWAGQLPEGVRNVLSIPMAPVSAQADAVDMALDALSYASTVGTGGLLDLFSDEDNPKAQGDLANAIRQAKATTGNPIERMHLINELYAQKHPRKTGAINLVTDPTNLIAGAGTVGKVAGKLPEISAFAKAAPTLAKDAAIATGKMSYVAAKMGQGEQQAAKTGARLLKSRDELTGVPKLDKAGTGVKWVKQNARTGLNFQSWLSSWKGQMVTTVRGLIQDFASGAIWAKDAGLEVTKLLDNFKSLADESYKRVKAGSYDLEDIYTILPERPGYMRSHFGFDNKLVTDKKGNIKTVAGMLTHDQMNELGQGAMESGTLLPKYLRPGVSAAVEAAQPMATPLRPKVPVLGQAVAGAQGYFRAGINGAYQSFNHAQHIAMRTAGWEQGFSRALSKEGDEFLALADDIEPALGAHLRQAGQKAAADAQTAGINLDEFTPESLFTREDILSYYGFRRSAAKGAHLDSWVKPRGMKQDVADSVMGLADEWQGRTLAAKDAGNARSIEIFKDFRLAEDSWEKKLGSVIPFMTWVIRAYPKTVEIMMKHPAMAHSLFTVIQNEADNPGVQPWEVGAVPINNKTPILGALVNVLSGDRDNAEMRVNFLQLLSPIPTDLVGGGGGAFEYADSPAEKVKATMDTVGFGTTPPVDWGLYLSGLTDDLPRSPSRIQGIVESAPGPEVPTARGIVSGIRSGQDKSTPYDPVERLARELVFEDTGLPSSDKRNTQLALEISKKEGIYKEAEMIYEAAQRNKSMVSQVNPTNVSVRSGTSKEAAIAREGIPYSYEDKQALTAISPSLGMGIDALNNSYKQQNPAAAVYDRPDISAAAKVDPRLAAFRADPMNHYLAQYAPTTYKVREQRFKESLGIK